MLFRYVSIKNAICFLNKCSCWYNKFNSYFRAFIGTIPSFFLIFIINPIKAFWFIVFIFCLQRVEGDLIYPRVVGGSVGLSSLWVMLAIMIGGSAFGFIGMLVGVPTAAVIYCVFGSVTNKRLSKKGIKIDEEEIEDSGKIHV